MAGMGFIGDVGLSSSTSSGAGGSQFGNVTVTDSSGGSSMPAYVKLALILGGILLALVLIRRL